MGLDEARDPKLRKDRLQRGLETDANGFEFEWYKRDPIIKQQNLKTRDFNKIQRVNEVWKKAIEKEDMIKPPPSIIDEAMRRKRAYQHSE